MRIAHYDPDALCRALRRTARRQVAVMVADGFCPDCGSPAPLLEYLECLEPYGGHLVLDDTQALGIWGSRPRPDAPYGSGGGGVLRLAGVQHPRVILVSSLAKGFGVPLSLVAGSRETVRRFLADSQTQVHCSPPAFSALRAAEVALGVNHTWGDRLRLRLAGLVSRFRALLARDELPADGGLFPVQSLCGKAGMDVHALYRSLLEMGVRTVLKYGRGGNCISFVITARHRVHDIVRGVSAFRESVARLDAPEASWETARMAGWPR